VLQALCLEEWENRQRR